MAKKGREVFRPFTDNRVGTYNIFITTDKELADHFSSYESFARFSADLNEFAADGSRSERKWIDKIGTAEGKKNYYETYKSVAGKRAITMLSSDVNLLEFEHSFNFGAAKTQGVKSPEIKLKTYEPGLEILKKFFLLSLGDRLSNLKYNKAALEAEGRDINLEGLEAALTGFGGLKAAKNDPNNPVLSGRELRDVIKKNMRGQRVYIAYGVGDDTRYWGGPFATILGQIEYSNDGKKETVTYHFTPNHISRQFDEQTTLDRTLLNFKTIAVPIIAWDYEGNGENKILNEWEGFTPSIHDCIVKLISNYFHKLGIKNHLIVLPNLDQLLSPVISEVLSQYYGSNLPTNADPLARAFEPLQEFRNLSMRLLGAEPLGLAKSFSDPTRGEGKIKNITEIQREFLSKIGLRGNNSEAVASDVDPVFYRGYSINERDVESRSRIEQAQDLLPGTAPSYARTVLWGAQSLVDYFSDPDDPVTVAGAITGNERETTNPDYSKIVINDPFLSKITDSADAVFSLELPFQAEEDAVGIKPDTGDYITVVQRLIENITNQNSTLVNKLTHYWEDDLDIINVFQEKFGNGTFDGYRKAINTKSRKPRIDVEVNNDSFFIFGDQDLIRDYLYGNIVKKVKRDPTKRSSYRQVERGVPLLGFLSTDNDNTYFLDPFWNRIQRDLDITLVDSGSRQLTEQNLTAVAEGSRSDKTRMLRGLNDTYFAKIQAAQRALHPTPLGFFNDYDYAKQEFTRSLPDLFSFLNKDENKSTLEDIFELNVPFFIANAENSNVLSYTFDADNFIFNQFLGSLEEIYYNVAYRYSTRLAGGPIDGKPSTEEQMQDIYRVLDNIRSHGSYGGAEFNSLGGTTINLAGLSTDLTDILIKETVGLGRSIRKNYYSDTIAICMLFMELFEKQYMGAIKTLPMFNLSNFSHMLKPGIVFLKSIPTLKTQGDYGMGTADFFSGLYKIVGFRHMIKNNKAESEFSLVKDIAGTITSADE